MISFENYEKAVDEFDKAAQEWGWESDQGYDGDSIQKAMKNYDDTKARLLSLWEDMAGMNG